MSQKWNPPINAETTIPSYPEAPRGFISVPKIEDLLPTPQEQEYLRQLLEWQKASARSTLVLGKPLPWFGPRGLI